MKQKQNEWKRSEPRSYDDDDDDDDFICIALFKTTVTKCFTYSDNKTTKR